MKKLEGYEKIANLKVGEIATLKYVVRRPDGSVRGEHFFDYHRYDTRLTGEPMWIIIGVRTSDTDAYIVGLENLKNFMMGVDGSYNKCKRIKTLKDIKQPINIP